MSDEITAELRDSLMNHFGQHVVGLAGTFYELSPTGERIGEEKFYFYSGCVFSVKGQWWIVTAGHVFHDLQPLVNTRKVEVRQQLLVDYFGEESRGQKPIPFDFLSMQKSWYYKSGLDFAVIPVTPYYRSLLESSQITPFNEIAFYPPPDIDYYQYRIYGCPEYLIKTNRIASDQPLTGFVKPTFPWVKREQDDISHEYPRFKGIVQDGLTSVKGLSGGPIIGLAMYKGRHIYNVLAIQSKWKSDTREIWGCPCSVFIPMAEESLKKLQKN